MQAHLMGRRGAGGSVPGAEVQGLLDEAEAMAGRGRHAEAERRWRALAAALGRRRAFDESARVWVRFGCHLLERGRPEDAVRAFDESVARGTDAGSHDTIAAGRIWVAAALIDAGRLVDAEGVCRDLLAGPAMAPSEHVRAAATHVRLLIWQRRLDEAAVRARDIVLAPGEAHAYARAMVVRLELLRGRLFEAGLAADALERVVSDHDDAVSRLLAATARLRVLAAAGRLASAHATCEAIDRLARGSRLPLRGVRARLIWAEALRRAKDSSSARRIEVRLRRVVGRAPLLCRALEHADAMGESPSSAYSMPRRDGGLTPQFVVDVHRALRARCDAETMRGVVALIAADPRVNRAELFVVRAGAACLVAGAGHGTGTTIGDRIASLGAEVGPVPGDDGDECGAPLRDAGALVGVLVLRCASGDATAFGERLTYLAGVLGPWVAPFDPVEGGADPASLMPEIIGVSRQMTELRISVLRAASAPFAVLIEGESGVGKELVARALHRLGPRKGGPFRGLNCAALTEDLLDAELFGHARGAFTGALADRRGLIEEADGGTLFLDELADLSPRGQAKLLRVLQEREVRRIGEVHGRTVDVRVVSAANSDMRARAEHGTFRPDLLYRLDVIRLDMPPLRTRPEDIAPLVRHFWRDATHRMGSVATLSRAVLEAWTNYHWPGNVRELQNVVAATSVLAPAHGEVQVGQLPFQVRWSAPRAPERLGEARAAFERRFIETALARAGGRRAGAARVLGVSRQGLAKLMQRHQIAGAVGDTADGRSV